MIVLVFLFALLFLLLLLAMPVVVTARTRISPTGGVIFATVTLLGAIPIPLKARLHLFHQPFLSLQLFGKTIPLKANDSVSVHPNAIAAERIDLGVTLGVSQDGARTVQLLGTLKVLCDMLLPLVFRRVSVVPHPSFDGDVFRLSAEIIGLVFPLFLFFPFTCIKKRGSEKPNEKPIPKKRYSHVPC